MALVKKLNLAGINGTQVTPPLNTKISYEISIFDLDEEEELVTPVKRTLEPLSTFYQAKEPTQNEIRFSRVNLWKKS